MRDQAKVFGIDLIEAVRSASIPILWVLPNTFQSDSGSITLIDVLKSLVQQAIRINPNFRTENVCALSCSRIQSAVQEADWFNILGSVMEGLPQVYVVFDLGTVGQSNLASSNKFSWPLAFLSLIQNLNARGSMTIVKLMFISYGEAQHVDMTGVDSPEDFIVKMDPRDRTTTRQHRRSRKLKFRLKSSRNMIPEQAI